MDEETARRRPATCINPDPRWARDDDWSETLRRFEEFERTGESMSVNEAFATVRARIEELRAQRQ